MANSSNLEIAIVSFLISVSAGRADRNISPSGQGLLLRIPDSFIPRDLTERTNEDKDLHFGYLMPDNAAEFISASLEDQYPGDWLEFHDDMPQLKTHLRKYSPIAVELDTTGRVLSDGMPVLFIPGSFRFCLNPHCDAYYEGSMRNELGKLSCLSNEGRSSATTMLVLSSLKHLMGTDVSDQAKKTPSIH